MASSVFAFEPVVFDGAELALQREVRDFLAAELPPGSFEPGLGMGGGRDRAFSRRLAERGWVGMALPKEYGGGARPAVHRFIVVEELLRWGAPVGHHWAGDRQTGPLIAAVGSPAQKERFLPAICRAEVSFSIGMSEPGSGSDLASLRTRARPTDGGWLITGRKVWTSGAHVNDWMLTLCRTSDEADRHAGLSQLLVDLRAPGVTVDPIPFLNGTAHFNEVTLNDVFVPDELVVGEIGRGWAQNTAELVYERGGPDRWLSPFVLLEYYLREHRPDPPALAVVGELTARWWTIRQLSLGVARAIDAGASPAVQAALVKEMGTRFEREVVDAISDLVVEQPVLEADSTFQRVLANAVLTSPSFTIRGGTTEVLRTVVARGLAS